MLNPRVPQGGGRLDVRAPHLAVLGARTLRLLAMVFGPLPGRRRGRGNITAAYRRRPDLSPLLLAVPVLSERDLFFWLAHHLYGPQAVPGFWVASLQNVGGATVDDSQFAGLKLPVLTETPKCCPGVFRYRDQSQTANTIEVQNTKCALYENGVRFAPVICSANRSRKATQVVAHVLPIRKAERISEVFSMLDCASASPSICGDADIGSPEAREIAKCCV